MANMVDAIADLEAQNDFLVEEAQALRAQLEVILEENTVLQSKLGDAEADAVKWEAGFDEVSELFHQCSQEAVALRQEVVRQATVIEQLSANREVSEMVHMGNLQLKELVIAELRERNELLDNALELARSQARR